MSPVAVFAAWVVGSLALIGAGVWLTARLRRSERRPVGMSLHAVEASLRPRGGHVEASPKAPPAPHTTNGNARANR